MQGLCLDDTFFKFAVFEIDDPSMKFSPTLNSFLLSIWTLITFFGGIISFWSSPSWLASARLPFFNYGCSLSFRISSLSHCSVINFYDFHCFQMILAFIFQSRHFLASLP